MVPFHITEVVSRLPASSCVCYSMWVSIWVTSAVPFRCPERRRLFTHHFWLQLRCVGKAYQLQDSEGMADQSQERWRGPEIYIFGLALWRFTSPGEGPTSLPLLTGSTACDTRWPHPLFLATFQPFQLSSGWPQLQMAGICSYDIHRFLGPGTFSVWGRTLLNF